MVFCEHGYEDAVFIVWEHLDFATDLLPSQEGPCSMELVIQSAI